MNSSQHELSRSLYNIPDPYRWLEDSTDPATVAWVQEREYEAEQSLHCLPSRISLTRQLRELASLPSVSVPRVGGSYEFYWRSHANGQPDTLYVRNRASGAERLLLDPADGTKQPLFAVRGIFPSPDGRYLAYRACIRNSDDATMIILDVCSGQPVLDVLGAKFGFPSWTPDSRGFFLTMCPLGINSSSNVGSSLEVRFISVPDGKQQIIVPPRGDPGRFLQARCSNDGEILIIEERHGWVHTSVKFVCLKEEDKHLYELVPSSPHIHDVLWWQGAFWIRTTAGAPNGRIDRITRNGDRSVVVAERKVCLRHHAIVGGQIIATYTVNGASEVLLVDPESGAKRKLRLPGAGTTLGLEGAPESPIAYFTFNSPSRSHAIYEADVRTDRARLWSQNTRLNILRGVKSECVNYISSDGTHVPMHLITQRASKEAKPRQTLLLGYGGFGVCMTPEYSTLHAIWLERGGALAFACLRGGGELGTAWHVAGCLERKQQVVKDLVAAAMWLCTEGVSSPDQLAVMGHSNGAMIAASAVLQFPEWFGAAILIAPLADMLRYHLHGLGSLWIGEYGSPDDSDMAEQLLSYSPYHLALKTNKHPPMLVLANEADDRVAPLHSRKLVAALRSSGAAPVLLRTRSFGHEGSYTVDQQVDEDADILVFLDKNLRRI